MGLKKYHAVLISSNDFWIYDPDSYDSKTKLYSDFTVVKGDSKKEDSDMKRCSYFFEVGNADNHGFKPTAIKYDDAEGFLVIEGEQAPMNKIKRRVFQIGEDARRYKNMRGPRHSVDTVVVSKDSKKQEIKDYLKQQQDDSKGAESFSADTLNQINPIFVEGAEDVMGAESEYTSQQIAEEISKSLSNKSNDEKEHYADLEEALKLINENTKSSNKRAYTIIKKYDFDKDLKKSLLSMGAESEYTSQQIAEEISKSLSNKSNDEREHYADLEEALKLINEHTKSSNKRAYTIIKKYDFDKDLKKSLLSMGAESEIFCAECGGRRKYDAESFEADSSPIPITLGDELLVEIPNKGMSRGSVGHSLRQVFEKLGYHISPVPKKHKGLTYVKTNSNPVTTFIYSKYKEVFEKSLKEIGINEVNFYEVERMPIIASNTKLVEAGFDAESEHSCGCGDEMALEAEEYLPLGQDNWSLYDLDDGSENIKIADKITKKFNEEVQKTIKMVKDGSDPNKEAQKLFDKMERFMERYEKEGAYDSEPRDVLVDAIDDIFEQHGHSPEYYVAEGVEGEILDSEWVIEAVQQNLNDNDFVNYAYKVLIGGDAKTFEEKSMAIAETMNQNANNEDFTSFVEDSLFKDAEDDEISCSCQSPRIRHAGVHPRTCEACDLIVDAETFEAPKGQKFTPFKDAKSGERINMRINSHDMKMFDKLEPYPKTMTLKNLKDGKRYEIRKPQKGKGAEIVKRIDAEDVVELVQEVSPFPMGKLFASFIVVGISAIAGAHYHKKLLNR